MDTNKTALERAFELARSGRCLSVSDIAHQLHSEGYSVAQLEGPLLRKQLSELIEKAKKPMPKGPKGEKRPADVIGAAILVGRIATGEAADKPSKAPNRAKAGGTARAKAMPSARLKTIAMLWRCISITTISSGCTKPCASPLQWQRAFRKNCFRGKRLLSL